MFNTKPFTFSKKSIDNLSTLHIDLQKILLETIKYRDFSIICGHRNEADQNKAFAEGKSKLKFPLSKHNSNPSLAVDIAPYPIDWNDTRMFIDLIRFIQGIAIGKFGIRIRAGADFNGDWLKNDSFLDYPHIELHSQLVEGVWVKYE